MDDDKEIDMKDSSAYYYNQLNKQQQKVYYAMKAGVTDLAPSFLVPKLSARELSDIYFLLRLDHPELFYSVKFTYRYYPDSENVEFMPEYLFAKNKIREHQQAMASRVKKLARAAEHLTEKEKELYIHDFICKNVRYDKLKKAYSHEIIGPLGQGVGVCEGIAKAVKILCDALGIWCVIAVSDNNPQKQIKYRHAWNVIRIQGEYFHLDATFDNSLGKEGLLRYDYVNLSDEQIFRDHEPVIWKVPACTQSNLFYYREKKLSFTKMEDVKKRSAQAVKKGRPLIFHWRGGYLTRAVLDEMLVIFKEEAEKKEKHIRVSLNWPQAVLALTFAEQSEAEEVIWQEANEGECDKAGECDEKDTCDNMDRCDNEDVCGSEGDNTDRCAKKDNGAR